MAMTEELPLAVQPFAMDGRRPGLVIVDEVKGFAAVGYGPLAPTAPDEQVDRMVRETDRLAKRFIEAGRPVLAFLDSHQPGKPEPPYPAHCEMGSGQENLVDELAWLDSAPYVTLLRKDCINGFIGGIDLKSGRNAVVDWITANQLDCLVVVGICTDICVMDFVLTLLSARNHGMTPGLSDIVVYEPGCATYDLPRASAERFGLPATATHPRQLTHHMGLYLMASRGALLADDLT